jgi:hypothetical protein
MGNNTIFARCFSGTVMALFSISVSIRYLFAQDGAVLVANYNNARTGANAQETTLTPANVPRLSLKAILPVDNCVYAHPLYVPNTIVNASAEPHNVIFIATTTPTIYAFDADNLNSPSLGMLNIWYGRNPGDRDVGDCSQPQWIAGPTGIMGTPAIDIANHIMWVVVNRNEPAPPSGCGCIRYLLVAFDYTQSFGSASIVAHQPRQLPHHETRNTPSFGGGPIVAAIPVASPDGAFDPTYQLQRPGLLFDPKGSNVSFGFGAYYGSPGGPPPYQGWVFTYNTTTHALQGALNFAGATNGAAVWMSGGGIASDDQNYMYFATANSRPPDYSALFQNAIVQASLSGNSVTGRYQPSDAVNWSMEDFDLGSSRVLVLPGTPYVLSGSKAGQVFVLDPINLAAGAPAQVCNFDMAFYAGLAAWYGPSGWNIYTWCSGDYLKMFSLNNLLSPEAWTCVPFPVCPQAIGLDGAPFTGAAVAVSGTGGYSSAGSNGIVWATYPDGDVHGFTTGHLVAYDANNLTRLYGPDSLNGMRFQKFTPPVIANGKVYVATASLAVLVYGL